MCQHHWLTIILHNRERTVLLRDARCSTCHCIAPCLHGPQWGWLETHHLTESLQCHVGAAHWSNTAS